MMGISGPRGAFILICGAIVIGIPERAAASDPKILNPLGEERSDGLSISFTLQDAFDEDILKRIQSGMEVTFLHTIQIKRRRLLWFNKKVREVNFSTSVKYDNLTKQYHLLLRLEGETIDIDIVDNQDEMMEWMAEISGMYLHVPYLDMSDGAHAVRARTVTKARLLFFFIPWDEDTGWKDVRLQPKGGPHG